MPPKSRLDRSDKLAILAVLLSFVAVSVSFYEAKVLKEQQEIMQAQQKASVWPYLRTNLKYEYSDKFWIRLSVENKGVGPALIHSSKLFINQVARNDYFDIDTTIRSFFPDSVDMGLSISGLEGVLLSPGEKVNILEIQTNRFKGEGKAGRSVPIDLSFCFCSIYEDCWAVASMSSGLEPIEQCEERKFNMN